MRTLLALLLTLVLAASAFAQDPVIVVLELEGPVTPVLGDYVERGIAEAEEIDAALVIVRLDTPGGRIDVMQRISKSMTGSRVPIVVWVAPGGAMAASAGTGILLSGHAAAMAPRTSAGAASVVDGQGRDLGETMQKKATSVVVTMFRGLAARRGDRAVDWAERTVLDAVMTDAEGALEMGVIDVIAVDRDELVARLQGRTVPVNGDQVELHLAGAQFREISISGVEKLLQSLADPTIAFLLLVLGLNAILFELASPGGYLAGGIGVICLVAGFYALGVLPVNYAGLILIVLAFVLFLIDVKASTHGVLTLGGIASLVFGAMVLFDSPYFQVWRPAIFGVALATAAFFAFVVTAAIRSGRRKPVTGREGLLGARGTSRSPLDPVGMVMVEGERWRARAEDGPIAAQTPVEVLAVDGMELRVRRV